ncbi:MAG TPA: hypothetical protein PKA63_01660 [Oligoflexia bacterium]|nr:hypothetical protein [Oligoflexia bacterium]
MIYIALENEQVLSLRMCSNVGKYKGAIGDFTLSADREVYGVPAIYQLIN